MNYRIVAIMCMSILCSTGCASIKSTLLARDECNQAWQKREHLNGIPITLKVPTHLKLYVFEKHYLEVIEVGGETEVRPVDLDIPIRDFAHELMYTDKIFTVDFKRPGAGPYNLRLDMSEEQYFAKIQHDITDETLQDVTGLLSHLVTDSTKGLLPIPAGTKPEADEIKSVVAVGVFEVDAPDFELQVTEFLNCHLNKSHDAWTVPPGVQSFKRVGIPSNDNTHSPYPATPLCPSQHCHGIPTATYETRYSHVAE